MSSSDTVVVTTVVAVDPATAFAAFTEQIDRWWKRHPRFRFSRERSGEMRLEPGVGGRLLEMYDEGTDDAFVVGTVRLWDPPGRLAFGFRARNFAPEHETEVEIRFEDLGDEGTRVTLEHRGLDRLPLDHPARRGLPGPAFTSMVGSWWAEQMVSARAHLGRMRADAGAGRGR